MADENKQNKEFTQELLKDINLQELTDARMHRYLYREHPGEEYSHEAIVMAHLENPTDYLAQIVNHTLAKKEYKKRPSRNLSDYINEKNIRYLKGKLNKEYDGQNPNSQCLWILHNLVRLKHTNSGDEGNYSDSEPGIPIKFKTKNSKADVEIRIDYFNEFLEQEVLRDTGFKTEQEQLDELLQKMPSQKKKTFGDSLRNICKKAYGALFLRESNFEPKENREYPLNFAKIIYVEAESGNTKLARNIGSRYITSLDNLVDIEKEGLSGLPDFEFSGVDEKFEGRGEDAVSKEVGVYYLIQHITSPKLDENKDSIFSNKVIKKLARTTKCPEDIPFIEKELKEKNLEGKLREETREYGREILQEEMIKEVIKYNENFRDLKNTPYAKINFSGAGYKGYIALIPFTQNLKANPITGIDSNEVQTDFDSMEMDSDDMVALSKIEGLRKEIRERRDWFNKIRYRNHRLDLCETLKIKARSKEDLINALKEYSFCNIYPEEEKHKENKETLKKDLKILQDSALMLPKNH